MENEKKDTYQRVTDQIVAAIEAGASKWRMPWHTSGKYAFSPLNVTSRKAYRGINTLVLWAVAQARGYDSGEWGTYKQWQERGAQVRKGEKSAGVVFWKFANGAADSEESGEETARSGRLLFVRDYHVFNAAQVDGYSAPADTDEKPMLERIARADAFFQAIGADLRHGGNSAHYAPMSDHIQMPAFQSFRENVGYYSVLAHEHTHWTAPASRCDRQLGKRFGDSAYAAEELIAELGAAFVCAELGLSTEPREDHASYIQSWLTVLKADKRAIFTAASKAQQAADFLVKRAADRAPAVAAERRVA